MSDQEKTVTTIGEKENMMDSFTFFEIDTELFINFNENVFADDFFKKAYILQNSCENEKIVSIYVNLQKTTWFDTLSLCYLILFLKKAKIQNNAEITFMVYREDEDHGTEKNIFCSYLIHTGFYFLILQLGAFHKDDDFVSNIAAFIGESYSSIHNCIYPVKIISDEKNVDIEISSFQLALEKYLNNELDSESASYSIHKVGYFLRESLDNVFNHAYDEGDCKLCCIMANIVNCTCNLDTGEYEKNYTSKTPYTNISLFNEKNEYIEIYVADVGVGLRRSFLLYPDTSDSEITDENILGYILTDGKRSQRKVKNYEHTQYGGLFNLIKTFYSDGDRISFKSDSRWLFGQSTPIIKRINKDVFQHEYATFIHGFTIIGFISLEKESGISQYYLSEDYQKNTFTYLYKENNCITEDDSIYIRDCRFQLEEREKSSKASILVFFPRKNMSKDEIAKILNNNPLKTVIIADIDETELKNYYMIFNFSKRKFKFINTLILISKSNSVAFFSNKDKELIYNKELSQKYIIQDDIVHINRIDESLISFRYWQKTYDSELLWEMLSLYNKYSFINDSIYWDNRELQGYLDFSQLCLIPECRDICIQQLFHIRPDNKKIYFRSIDRFTEDICNQANKIMDNSSENEIVWIGSVFVSGTSEHYGQYHTSSDKKFYFFQHPGACKKIYSLFEWDIISRKIDLWFPKENYTNKKYVRVGKTSFLANNGIEFWLKKHYLNEETSFRIPHNKTYSLIQNQHHINPPVLMMKHFDLTDHHDLIYLNPLVLFENDMINNNSDEDLGGNSYDYLLTQFFSALQMCPKLSNINMMLNSQLNPVIKRATISKLKSHYKNYNREDDKKGLIIYFADYETSRIVEKLSGLLSDGFRQNIIPVISIGKNYFSTTLNLSPLLLEKIENQIRNIKKINNENTKESSAKVTIFISTTLSAQLRKQLKHIIYRLGATDVVSLTITDRQRFPLGTYTGSHSAFFRLDIPELGNESECPVCSALDKIMKFQLQIRTDVLTSRCYEILRIWQVTKTSDRHINLGVSISEILLPSDISEEIDKYSRLMNLEEIKITTNFGLAIFCIENAVITLSSDFLEICLCCNDLQDDLKILLLASYLLLINKMQISEMYMQRLLFQISKLLKNKKEVTNITALAFISIIAQNKYYLSELYKEIVNTDQVMNNNDYLLLLLFLNFNTPIENNGSSAALMYHYVNSSSKLETIYNILLYTELNYIQSHSQAFAQIYYSSGSLNSKIYDEAKGYAEKLKLIYQEKMTSSLFFSYYYDEKVKSQIIESLSIFNNLLINNKFEQARENLKFVISQTSLLNKGIYLQAGDEDEVRLWIDKCREKALEKTDLQEIKLSIHIGVYQLKNNEKNRPWFYTCADVSEEVNSLIVDICLYRASEINDFFNDQQSLAEQYDGIIKVIFKREWVSIYFYNSAKANMNITDIIKRKYSKEDRPSMIIFKEFEQKLFNLGASETKCFEWKFVEKNFPNAVDQPNHLLRAEMKIPYVDMGSSFRK